MLDVATQDLPNDVESLRDIVLDQQQQLARFAAEIRELHDRLRQLIENRFGRSSEKIDPGQLHLFARGDDTAIAEEEPIEETVTVPGHKRRKRATGGREPFPDHLPRNVINCDPPEEERICSCCGQPLIRIGEEVTERGHLIPASFVVNRYVRGKYACREGHDGVKIAPAPPALIDKAKYETSMYAHLVCAKYADHLPLHRLHGIFKRHGLKVPKSVMWSMIERAAELLQPVVAQMKAEVLALRYVGADETPITVLIPGKKGSQNGYIWAYVARSNGKLRPIFDFTISRSRAGPNQFLQSWVGGIMQVDGYSGYNELARRPDIIRAGCWSHVRRKFKDAIGSDSRRAASMLLLFGRLYWIEAALKKRRDARQLDESDFFELRRRVRGRRSRVVLDQIRELAESFINEGRILPRSPMGKAVDYMLNEWSALEVFLDHGFVEADNNDVERAIRHIAIGRKNWMFAGSERGAWVSCLHFSIVSCCKALDIDPEVYIADTLEAVATTPASDVAQLTPWAWAERRAAEPTD